MILPEVHRMAGLGYTSFRGRLNSGQGTTQITLLLIIFAGVVQWQNFGFPSRSRGSDSRRLLHSVERSSNSRTVVSKTAYLGANPGLSANSCRDSAKKARPPFRREIRVQTNPGPAPIMIRPARRLASG